MTKFVINVKLTVNDRSVFQQNLSEIEIVILKMSPFFLFVELQVVQPKSTRRSLLFPSLCHFSRA